MCHGDLQLIGPAMVNMAKKASVPVVIHYDHGLTYEKCVEALEVGFTSVMYDCSTASYEENVNRVKEMAAGHCDRYGSRHLYVHPEAGYRKIEGD